MANTNKYILLNSDTKSIGTTTLYRIQSIKDFNAANNPKFNIKRGDKGGYIERYGNLSQQDSCWVDNEASVFANAIISEDAYIYQSASVYGNAKILGSTRVFGHAEVFGNAIIGDYRNYQLNQSMMYVVSGHPNLQSDNNYRYTAIFGNAWVYGNCVLQCGVRVYGNAEIIKGNIIGYLQIFGNVIIDTDKNIISEYNIYNLSDPYYGATTGYIFDNAKINQGTSINFVPFPNKIDRRGSNIKYTGKIFGNAIINNSRIEGYPLIFDNALIQSSTVVSGSMVYGDATVRNNSVIGDQARVHDNAELDYATAIENCQLYEHCHIIGSKHTDTSVEYDVNSGSYVSISTIITNIPLIRGNARVFGNAYIMDSSIIQHDAQIFGDAVVQNSNVSYNSLVYDNSYITAGASLFNYCEVYGTSRISGSVQLYDNCRIYQNAHIYGETKIGDDARVHGSVVINCINKSADYIVIQTGDKFPKDHQSYAISWQPYDKPLVYPIGSDNKYHESYVLQNKAQLLQILYNQMYTNGQTQMYREFKYKRIVYKPFKKTYYKTWKVSMSILQFNNNLDYYNIGDNADVYGETIIQGQARINGNAEIMGGSYISGSWIYDDAVVSNSIIIGNCQIYESAKILNVSNSYTRSGLYNNQISTDSIMRIYGNTIIHKLNNSQLKVQSNLNIFGNTVIETKYGNINIIPYDNEYTTIYNTKIYNGDHMMTSSEGYSNSIYPKPLQQNY